MALSNSIDRRLGLFVLIGLVELYLIAPLWNIRKVISKSVKKRFDHEKERYFHADLQSIWHHSQRLQLLLLRRIQKVVYLQLYALRTGSDSS